MKLNTSATIQVFHNYHIGQADNSIASPSLQPPINIIGWLNRILVEEAKCVLRYRRHYFSTLGPSEEISNIFLINANQKARDVDVIARLITELGGVPGPFLMNVNMQAHNNYAVKARVTELIKENLAAERLAVNSYNGILNYLLYRDPTTAAVLENILLSDERRIGDLVEWLVSAQTKVDLAVS